MLSTSLNLKYWPEEILSQKLEDQSNVPDVDWYLMDVFTRMNQIMRENHGYGLAANQVGYNRRIFVMIDTDEPNNHEKFLPFINPVIVERSSEMESDLEGCLSFPGQRVRIMRAHTVDVEFETLAGETLTWHFEGRSARCVQHEIDHLDGIMIFEHVKANLARKMTLEKYFKNKRKYVRL